MSDSIDRVFAHALQTVRKIPRASAAPAVPGSPSLTGSASATSSAPARRPPTEDRLRLYGLYKQSMEGDVLGVMERPTNRLDAEKWDAWNAVRGLSRTQAKRRYIECLIETMKKYASDTPDARSLVAELEFVWDQVKSNSASSRGHSANPSQASITYPAPYHNYHSHQSTPAPPQQQMYAQPPPPPNPLQFARTKTSPPPSPTSVPLSQYRQEPSRPPDFLLGESGEYREYVPSEDNYEHLITPGRGFGGNAAPLRRMNVGSHGTRSLHSGDDGEDGYEDTRERLDDDHDGHLEDEDEDEDEDDEDYEDYDVPGIIQLHHPQTEHSDREDEGRLHEDEEEDEEDYDEDNFPRGLVVGRDTSPDIGTTRWQLRVERAMLKMSAEVAALREQLEIRNAQVLQNSLAASSSWFWSPVATSGSSTRDRSKGKEVVGVRKRVTRAVWGMIWNVLRHMMVDAVVVGIVVWWVGRRRGGEQVNMQDVWRWIAKLVGGRSKKRGRVEGGEIS